MTNTREKLIELLNGLQDYGIKRTPGLALPGLPCNEIIAYHLIANGVTVQDSKLVDFDQFKEWIPVTERLPEKEGTYLTYTEKETIHLDCFCIYPNHGTQFWVRGNGKVTHWMPLPEPPKGE